MWYDLVFPPDKVLSSATLDIIRSFRYDRVSSSATWGYLRYHKVFWCDEVSSSATWGITRFVGAIRF